LMRLRIDAEIREIRDELDRSKFRDKYLVEYRGAVRPKDFVRSLLDIKPAFVHFSGHGTARGALCFETEEGDTHEVDPEALGDLFKAHKKYINCVLLNACYSERQAMAIAATVPYVVGMAQEIGDKAAIAFARGFYRIIGAEAEEGIKEAF